MKTKKQNSSLYTWTGQLVKRVSFPVAQFGSGVAKKYEQSQEVTGRQSSFHKPRACEPWQIGTSARVREVRVPPREWPDTRVPHAVLRGGSRRRWTRRTPTARRLDRLQPHIRSSERKNLMSESRSARRRRGGTVYPGWAARNSLTVGYGRSPRKRARRRRGAEEAARAGSSPGRTKNPPVSF